MVKEKLMNDQDKLLENDAKPPLSYSISGRNSHTFFCIPRQQSMQFASCIARQGAMAAPGVKVPDDWRECGRHHTHNDCVAMKMRAEELAVGHSIYFRKREAVAPVVKPQGVWQSAMGRVSTGIKAVREYVEPPAPAPKRAASMLDSIGNVGSYADVVNKIAAEHKKVEASQSVVTTEPAPVAPIVTAPAPKPAPKPVPTAPAGPATHESPLQMARRINAERAAAKQSIT
jgi:hypothetical protein